MRDCSVDRTVRSASDDSRKGAKHAKYETKLQTRNPKSENKSKLIKNQKVPNNLISDFDFWISDFNSGASRGNVLVES